MMGMVVVAFLAASVAAVPTRHDDLHLEPNELLREGSEELGSAVGVASLDEQILALCPTKFAQRSVCLLEHGRSRSRT